MIVDMKIPKVKSTIDDEQHPISDAQQPRNSIAPLSQWTMIILESIDETFS